MPRGRPSVQCCLGAAALAPSKQAPLRPAPCALLQSLKLQSCKLEDFEVERLLGTGSFGRVSLARHRQTGAVCAIKALSKAHIVKNQQISHLRSERDILREVDHPLIVRMWGCCQVGRGAMWRQVAGGHSPKPSLLCGMPPNIE